jgi:hypothetical protein
VPESIERLRLYVSLGIDRVVFSLPAAGEDEILPILDRWSALQGQLQAA